MEKELELFTTNSAARFLEVSLATVRLYADSGRLPVVRTVSGMRLFQREDLEALRRMREQASTRRQQRRAAR
ncbi:MAG: helix-turn-helix domain-containing protein [candidate division NC10 bacterium]|jgi:excisionase family DNA binding protein